MNFSCSSERSSPPRSFGYYLYIGKYADYFKRNRITDSSGIFRLVNTSKCLREEREDLFCRNRPDRKKKPGLLKGVKRILVSYLNPLFQFFRQPGNLCPHLFSGRSAVNIFPVHRVLKGNVFRNIPLKPFRNFA